MGTATKSAKLVVLTPRNTHSCRGCVNPILTRCGNTLMHDYKTAAARMKYVLAAYTNKRILDRFSEGSAYLPQKDVINAMYYYLEGMGELDDSAVVVSFLERFFSHSVIKEIEAVFCGMSNCIAKLLPSLSPEYPQTRSIEVYRQLQHKLFQAQSDNPISLSSRHFLSPQLVA